MINDTQKFNLKEESKKLAEIMDAKAPAVPIAKEELKQAVLKRLPIADNPDVKDFNNFLYPEKPANTPAEGLEKKQRFIEKSIDKKNNSIIEAAARRDAVIFANTEFGSRSLGQAIKESEEGKTTEQILIELLDKWTLFFETRYSE